MSETFQAVIAALVAELLENLAGPMLAADAACDRVNNNPGLIRAQETVANWLATLAGDNKDAALSPKQIDEALRALLVRAVSRGSVEFNGDPDHGGPTLVLAPEDFAPLEVVREMARMRDAADGSSIVANFDAYRDDTIERIFLITMKAVRAHC